MIIYNVTIKVDKKIATQWYNWLVEEHIPDVMNTKCFNNFRVVRLLEVDDTEGPTYAIQYFCTSINDYKIYIDNYSAEMRNKGHEKWGDQFIAFRSLMEVVQ